MRRLIIGDVHGCFDELQLLLEKFDFKTSRDSLIFVGDIMGKGPNSLGVLEFMEKVAARSVIGNHEEALLKYYKMPQETILPHQKAYLDSLKSKKNYWVDRISSWPYFLEFNDLVVVHAGLQPNVKKLTDMESRILCRIRSWDGVGHNLNEADHPAWFDCMSFPKKVVFGHWAVRGLQRGDWYLGLDTGCVYGRQLSAYCPEEDKLYQVNSLKAYAKYN